MRPKAVKLIGNCVRCGEAVEFILTKKQVKALWKAFKAGSPSEAEILAEKKGALDYEG